MDFAYWSFVAAFAVAGLVAYGLTPLVRRRAIRLGMLDVNASARKVHTGDVPRLGGIALVVAFFTPLAGIFFRHNVIGEAFFADWKRPLAIFGGGLCIALLGVVDDVRGLSAKAKFPVQFAVAAGVWWLGFRVGQVATPWGVLELGWASLPFTVLWIVGVVNAMNLIDGLDGLASGVALAAVAVTFVISFRRLDLLMCLYSASLAGALVGFLRYNFNPATIFMGDTGSMFLGFILATTSIQASQKSSTAVAMIVPIVALGVPIMDTLLAMLRRALRGRPLFSADREHMHHRLLDLGLTHRQAVLTLYVMSIAFCVLALGLSYANSAQTAALLALTGGIAFVVVRYLGYWTGLLESAKAAERRRRNREITSGVAEASRRLRQAADTVAMWEALKPMADVLGAEALSLDLGGQPFRFERRSGVDESLAIAARFPVRGKVVDGTLVVTWVDGRRGIERDEQLAIEGLCTAIAAAPAAEPRGAEPNVPHGEPA